MRITFLGTGTSTGVPLLACECKVCTSTDSRDKRLRSSVLIQDKNTQIVIDIGPDFRQQMLKENVKHLDGVLITHGHKDHTGGLDDIRAYNFAQNENIAIYCDTLTEQMIVSQYDYIFTPNPYPGVPKIDIVNISNEALKIKNITIEPLNIWHGKMPIKGFKIGGFVYLTDLKTMDENERKKIRGCDVLVINAIRHKPHHSHFNLEEAIAFVKDIKPKQSYFTHISHWLGKHNKIENTLPKNIHLAYDGLVLKA